MKISSFLYAFASLALTVIISGQANAADTVALISDVFGNVVVKTSSGSSPAKLLATVSLGARIDLSEGAKLSMIYVAKGDEYKLSGPGSYQVDDSSPQTISGKAPAKQASLGGALNGKRIRSENVAQASIAMRGIKKAASSEAREQATKLRPGKNGSVSERVAYGLWLESENLADEARQVWKELAEEFPDQPNLRDRAVLKQ